VWCWTHWQRSESECWCPSKSAAARAWCTSSAAANGASVRRIRASATATAEVAIRYVELAEDLRAIIGNVSYRTSCDLSTDQTNSNHPKIRYPPSPTQRVAWRSGPPLPSPIARSQAMGPREGDSSPQVANEHRHDTPTHHQILKRPPRGDGWSEDSGGDRHDRTRQPSFSSRRPLCYDCGARIPRPKIVTGE
jgi:hypothetical protein